jgi:CRP/FNR family transcriptional regulator, dissimilatory nitrate respiration regulator
MYQEWINTLNSCALFRNIGSESLNIMLDCLKPKVSKYKQAEQIINYGQRFQGIGIIAGGRIAITKETYSGNRIIMGILNTGDIFGETVAFSDSKIWPMTVIAREDSVLLFLPPDKLAGTCSNICLSHSTMITNMLNILSNRAALLAKKIEYMSIKNIRGKICSYLLDLSRKQRSSKISVPMKRHEMADYLGVPRPSLSREMGLMRDDSIIEFNGAQIDIKNIYELEKQIS